ncbi:GerAB/ArcD/ProY family transporter [Cohnella rhizosphaerae]|uniref:Spore germination protein n=1 Tax=Cohnella rhizosphaerae TaxID=1457232 RepID=A0A9X4KRN1_9BACL|nr:GerAB/ArcD/ProY family transporter [Cohnella rhizosphaerae]MDG0808966.1 spore germination protein [Cohnella rhizosphaerae]
MLDRISPGAWICLIFSFISGFSTLFLQEAKLLGPDVWMSYICGIAISFGVLCVFYAIQRSYPDLPMPAVFDRLLGKNTAKIVLGLYLAYILEIQGAAFQALTSFYRTVVLPNASSGHIILLLALTTAYASSLGLGTIVRTVQVLLSFFLFFYAPHHCVYL